MALIKCPECGKEISDKSKRCISCGYKLKNTEKKSKNRKPVIIAIVVIVLALLGVGGGLGYKYYIVPMNLYNKAESLLKNKKFDAALNEFEKLGNYKDSKNKIIEVHYKKADFLLSAKAYEDAINEFKSVGDYGDAVEKIMETKYQWASESDADKALELYKELGDYKDSKNKYEEIEEENKKQEALKRMRAAYDSCLGKGVSISSDGKSIIIDSKGENDILSLSDVQGVIKRLKLPSTLFDEMCLTNSLMGRQTEEFEYYEVSWSYHPDNGLDAVFKFRY